MTQAQELDIDAIKSTLVELENKRFAAIVDGDLETFASCCHPDLVYTHSNGSRDTLDSYLDKVTSGFYVYHRIDHPTEDIIVKGDTAVVVGEMNASITANGVEKDLVNSSIAVWVKENDQWLLLAYQPTPRPSH